MIKGILFDKDGTLIEFERMWHEIMTLVFSNIKNILGYDQLTIEKLMKISGYTKYGFDKESIIQYMSTREIINLWTNQLNITDDNINIQLIDFFNKASINDNLPIYPLDGVLESLLYLKQKGYYLGIATADMPNSTIHSLKKAKIYDYFDFIGTDNGTMKAKPHPDMAYKFSKQIRIQKTELLIVGDSINDYNFAKESGASFAGIKSSYGKLDDCKNRDFILVDSLKTLIDEINL